MTLFFTLLISFFLTIVLIPPLRRFAGPLGLIDQPGARRRHALATPRCGGIGLVLGAAVPTLMWLPIDMMAAGILAGGAVITLFGLWDDRVELDYRIKLAGQGIAVALAVGGGLLLTHLPFLGLTPISPWIAFPVTGLFMLAMINATNLSDGLDGLAAGCAAVSLGGVAVLAYQVDGFPLLVLTLATIGGLLGFLRYNTHPAMIFLGDSGSQFLGYMVGCLAVALVSTIHVTLSPALPLLLVGVPLIDAVWVALERLHAGSSPFAADRRHLHYKLIDLGLRHHEAVALIYAVQALFVGTALLIPYESDAVVMAVYSGYIVILVGSYALAAAYRPFVRGRNGSVIESGGIERRNLWLRRLTWLPATAERTMAYLIALFMVGGAFSARLLSYDLAALAAILVVLLIIAERINVAAAFFIRLGLYVASIAVVYLLVPLPEGLMVSETAIDALFIVLVAATAVAVRVTRRELFRVTPQDLLILFIALVVPHLSGDLLATFPVSRTVFRLVVLFYAAEFLLASQPGHHRDAHSRRVLYIATGLSMVILACRPVLA